MRVQVTIVRTKREASCAIRAWSGGRIHLAEISQCLSVGAIAFLVLDGVGWHTSPKLRVPANIVLLPLPPYAPELNPVENVWEFMHAILSAIVCGRPTMTSSRLAATLGIN
jgi:DDE superfamily endonuclease